MAWAATLGIVMGMDMRRVGQGMRRRFGGEMNHLQMAADAAAAHYPMHAGAGLGGDHAEQGELFNRTPTRTYDLATSKTTSDWGGPNYGGERV